MIKLLQSYKSHQKGELLDLGCVLNSYLVKKKMAVWIKIEDVKMKIK
jgi:hypothetical protein